MSHIFNFIVVQDVTDEVILHLFQEFFQGHALVYQSLYLSILRVERNVALIEVADFVPVSRYRDVTLEDFFFAFAKTLSAVSLVDKNLVTKVSKYKKVLNASVEADFYGEGAVEYGLSLDFGIQFSHLADYIQRVWANNLHKEEAPPSVYQVISDWKMLAHPVRLDFSGFYG